MSNEKRDQRDSFFDESPIAFNGDANGEETIEDKELKQLLESWRAPVVAASHERRLVEAYRQQQSEQGADAAVALRPNNKEVAKMKTCTTCHEEFADKFSFCPVDGTPLNGLNAGAVEPVLTSVEEPVTLASAGTHAPANGNGNLSSADGNGKYVLGDGGAAYDNVAASAAAGGATAGASAAMSSNNEFHLTMIEDAGLINRLTTELREVAQASQLTWPEFKRDPVGFTRRSAAAYGALVWRFFRGPNVALACLIALFTVLSAIVIIGLLDRRATELALNEPERADQILDFTEVPEEQPKEKPDKGVGDKKDEGRVGFNKGKGEGSKPKFEKAQGGGGGGRQEQKPASQGGIPPASMIQPQIVTPNPNPPAIKSPRLPVAVVSKGDPALFPTTTPPVFGVPSSKSKEPSSGPGTGDGIGNGSGNNIGSGNGSGYGKGEGYNIGGGSGKLGGGGSSGGNGGNAEENYNRTFKATEVTQKVRLLTKPEPGYTEEARKNQTTGTVTLRLIFNASGQVTNVSAVNGLPYGLTEKAIEAARQIKFSPAMKNGHAVSSYGKIEYAFNIY
ncbi:MAG: energy transducer TonB [Pyrinomonadaceae bacterium]